MTDSSLTINWDAYLNSHRVEVPVQALSSFSQKVFEKEHSLSPIQCPSNLRSFQEEETTSRSFIVTGLKTAFHGFLPLSGIGSMGSAIRDLENGWKGRNWEQGFFSLSELISGVSNAATGAFVLVEWTARFNGQAGLTLFAGAIYPITAIGIYAANCISSTYKVYLLSEFSDELKCKMERGDLGEVLRWMKSKTQIHGVETLEGESSMKERLHRKWHSFRLRAATDSFGKLMDRKGLDALIEDLKKDVPRGKNEASALINEIYEKNRKGIKWQLFSAIGNFVGVGVAVTYTVLTGGSGSALSSVAFALASAVSFVVESPKARRWFEEKGSLIFLNHGLSSRIYRLSQS